MPTAPININNNILKLSIIIRMSSIYIDDGGAPVTVAIVGRFNNRRCCDHIWKRRPAFGSVHIIIIIIIIIETPIISLLIACLSVVYDCRASRSCSRNLRIKKHNKFSPLSWRFGYHYHYRRPSSYTHTQRHYLRHVKCHKSTRYIHCSIRNVTEKNPSSRGPSAARP